MPKSLTGAAVVALMLSDATARSQVAATAGLVVVILVVYVIARARQ